ncbi:aldolase [Zhengella mangrovi]|uniref:Aldolase n=1 Tax=Zhengella mangrovi TaxID=1982044 RepID=A0A2G1QJZ5_9HYPH|nr:class II aldolase/adducin family protein [Zhengella mangrovi]PHP65857.1 aldolase [Zhengella mangrovi]
MTQIANDPEFQALRTVSARAGADPLLVQAAGGNTSIKRDGILWIKASGTWLMNADKDDIFVPVDLGQLNKAVRRDDGSAEKAQDFVVADRNPSGLRPSIETTVHSALPQDVVIHVHCVGTIAHAVRADAGAVLAEKLAGLDWAFVPYVKPGLTLSHSIEAVLKPETRVLVLGNHGLVVCGDTVAETEALMDDVHARLTGTPRATASADIEALKRLAQGTGYDLPADPASHGAALDAASAAMAGQGSLYPDHVIFLGVGSVLAGEGETAADVAARFEAAGLPAPVSILFPGKGVLMNGSANAGAQALARCLADVTTRIPAGTALNYLTEAQNAELLDWDAEKYRQALNNKGAGA